ncbi:MAG: bifunctional phosphoglucose/phosphomannose isomerase [Actinomycetota bacterium]
MDLKVDLDDPSGFEAVDLSDMLGAVERFGSQVREALEIGRAGISLPSAEGVRNVVVLGMGGSGVSGDVVGALAPASGLEVPLVTVKGYTLPRFVDQCSLVFAVSYSGNTEETLECVQQASMRGARLVGVTSGGALRAMAEEKGFPAFYIPGGMQPRASLGYLFVPVACALERMGLVSGLISDLEGAVPMLEERGGEHGRASELDNNPTKRLAKELPGQLLVIYGSEGALAVAALRWKAQLNENSKVPAFHNSFPELNHNETVGWQHLEEICGSVHLVVLRETGGHPRIEKRVRITLDLIGDRLGAVTHVCARGENAAERLLDLVYFGDFVSVYLALLLGQDPTPVTRIEELKKRMSGPE